MIPELAHLCAIITLSLALLQLLVAQTSLRSLNMLRAMTIGQTFFIMLAFCLLALAFVRDDFSVAYIVHNANSALPWYYKVTAIWGAHEGSLLLWVLILNLWGLALALSSRNWPRNFSDSTLLVFAAINAGFLIILLWLANPFVRVMHNIPVDGNDLNPLLQDLAMIMHPPILYTGYVGCSAAFALAMAALWQNKLDQALAQLLRPWVLSAWLFLTLGIALGSWWAYYELGWGGWWFWDPVENASFMPWLTATALLHCLAASKKHGQLIMFAMLLAIITFVLSLFGTFLVRSGTIISVHAFAKDPQRGIYILLFLCAVLVGSLLLFAMRMVRSRMSSQRYALDRTSGLLLTNCVVLTVAAGTVLLGTLFPVIYEATYGAPIAVGYPYFNTVFVPIMLLVFAIMIGGLLGISKKLLVVCTACGVAAAVFLYVQFGQVTVAALVGVATALAIIASSWRAVSMSMLLAHIGLAVTIFGISITPNYEIERDVRMQVGDQVALADYNIALQQVDSVDGANYVGFRGTFAIRKAAHSIATLYPEKRIYLAPQTALSETAILPRLSGDIYIALGQKLAPATWSVRIYFKPFVRCIWLGCIIMALGAASGMLRKKSATIYKTSEVNAV